MLQQFQKTVALLMAFCLICVQANFVLAAEEVLDTQASEDIETETEDEGGIDSPELLNTTDEDLVMEITTSDPTKGDVVIDPLNDPFQNIAGLQGEYTVSEFTGELNYNYPIYVPPGRNGLQPNLSLKYSNIAKNTNSNVGFGWELEIPKIERYTRKGVEHLYSDNNFTSPFAGNNGVIFPENTDSNGFGSYLPKVQSGEFTHEFLSDESWLVVDSAGTQYSFGESSEARIDNDDGSLVHTWFLTTVEDTNGNTIEYEYRKSQGNVYLKRIANMFNY